MKSQLLMPIKWIRENFKSAENLGVNGCFDTLKAVLKVVRDIEGDTAIYVYQLGGKWTYSTRTHMLEARTFDETVEPFVIFVGGEIVYLAGFDKRPDISLLENS